jgi:hypothetical protein
MNMKKTILKLTVLAAFLLFSVTIFAQLRTNKDVLEKFRNEKESEWELKEKKVKEFAVKHHLPVVWETRDGTMYQMVDVVDGVPQYYVTYNLGAAHTTRAYELWPGGSTGLDLTGKDYTGLGEWDGGAVRITHQEFTDGDSSRVKVMDGASVRDHATHVAGTLIAAGVEPQAKGMAFEATLRSWDWTNDLSEMADAAADGLEISNHSYGYIRGWYYDNGWKWAGTSSVSETEDYRFGFYDNTSKDLDILAFNAPYYLIIRAAGNDRGDGPSDAGQNGKPEKDGGDDGFDCIGTEGVAKNVLTVGAVYGVPDYTGPEGVVMSGFSCWGPADDGRVKPDIVAKGVSVFSSTAASDDSYASWNGTSMAAPNASGTMALLQQYYHQSHGGVPMRSATLKGLVIHTADEAGPALGPDYMFGWGLMNAKKAARVIKEDGYQNTIDELALAENEQYERMIEVPGGNDLKVTICWTDRAGAPVPAQLDPVKKMLVNDLDLKIIGLNDTVYYPWRLNRDDPSAPAVRDAKNGVDNVEVVYVENAPAGIYKIVVTHDGDLITPQQYYSMIISGIDEFNVEPECSVKLVSPANGDTGVMLNAEIRWEEADFATSYDVYFGTDGNGTDVPGNVFNGVNVQSDKFRYLMKDGATYYLKVVPRNSAGEAMGCDDIWTFSTMNAISNYPYVQDVEGVTKPDLPQYWQAFNYSEIDWQSFNLISNSGSYSLACLYTGGLKEIDMDNWLVSPPLKVQAGNEYLVSFELMTYMPSKKEHMSLFWCTTPYPEDMTHKIWEDTSLSYTEFNHFEFLFTPDQDTNIYLGWHLSTPQGYGVFMDDIIVEDWGFVGVTANDRNGEINVYAFSREVNIIVSDLWKDSELMIFNMMGQQVDFRKVDQTGKTVISLQHVPAGIYLVTVRKGDDIFAKKLILN